MTSQPDQTPAALTWDAEMANRWLAHAEQREAQLAPVLEPLFGRAGLEPGMRVLDVGCGAGPTTAEAARRVAPDGHVTGVDISPSMISAARSAAGGLGIDWLVADAQSYPFAPAAFDAVISRFGVMFFADPLLAFKNLARATRPSGRLAMAVWPERDKSEIFSEPLRMVTRTLDRLGVRYQLPPVDAPPFTMGNPDRVQRLLATSGWADIEILQDQQTLYLGGPGGTPEQAADQLLELGVTRTLMEDQPAPVVDAVRAAMADYFRERHDGVGVGFTGGFLIISARRHGGQRGPEGNE